MMKFLAFAIPPLLLAVGANADTDTFSPYRLSYGELVQHTDDNDSRLVEALSKVGMVSIKDIPGYDDLRQATLSSLPMCSSHPAVTSAKDHTFEDGTTRTTFATRTIPGPGGAQEIPGLVDEIDGVKVLDDCREFVEASNQLRSLMDQVIKSFSNKVASLLQGSTTIDNENSRPMLETPQGYDFATFADVVENGEHLEHFHSYVRDGNGEGYVEEDLKTIDYHVDQGLFIAFTPAHAHTTNNEQSNQDGDLGVFSIALEDGSHPQVIFHDDDLVIMFGDGVNQFVNPHQQLNNRQFKIRATPHALRFRGSVTRTWHGRMVLPPSDALHESSGETYGTVRQGMIDASLDNDSHGDDILAIGCSGSNAVARQLEEATCEAGSIYCWHRCMVHADHNITIAACDALGLQLQCINPREQVSDGDSHGDYFPACSNSIEVATDYPPIPGYPRDPEICDQESWETFSDTSGYDFSFDDLGDNQGNRGYWDVNGTKGKGKLAKLMWSVTEDNKINGKVVFNGGFGYLAIGFAYPGGGLNGMRGASIIMAIPGGNYSAKYGLDLALGEDIQEYVIDMEGSAFRHWSDPLPNRDTSNYQVSTEDDCFTALSFTTDNINDIKFNVTGVDDMIWAGNLKDRFCGSHGRGQEGRGDRDRFMVEWKTGKAWFPAPPPPPEVVEVPATPGAEEDSRPAAEDDGNTAGGEEESSSDEVLPEEEGLESSGGSQTLGISFFALTIAAFEAILAIGY